jgi:CDP-diacylglycerol--glycerol-3-phosphate 3-phosphatidyltransferase
MHKRSYYIVNGITLYRLVAAPFLFLLIIIHRPDIFKWFLAASFFTDAIDGFMARRYKVVSVLGSKLDSIADDLTIAAAITAMIILKPEFLRKEILLVIVLTTLYVFQTILAMMRYGRISSFHTYAAKAAAILQGIFLLLLFFLEDPVYILFYIAAAATMIDLIEEIILVLLLPEWQTDVKGLYWIIRKKKAGQS